MAGAMKAERAGLYGPSRVQPEEGALPHAQHQGQSHNQGQGHLPEAGLGQLAVVGGFLSIPTPILPLLVLEAPATLSACSLPFIYVPLPCRAHLCPQGLDPDAGSP